MTQSQRGAAGRALVHPRPPRVSAARTVTGRVLEAGNGQISAPSTSQPGPQFPLPSLMSPEAADVLLPRVLASAAPPPEVLNSQS